MLSPERAATATGSDWSSVLPMPSCPNCGQHSKVLGDQTSSVTCRVQLEPPLACCGYLLRSEPNLLKLNLTSTSLYLSGLDICLVDFFESLLWRTSVASCLCHSTISSINVPVAPCSSPRSKARPAHLQPWNVASRPPRPALSALPRCRLPVSAAARLCTGPVKVSVNLVLS